MMSLVMFFQFVGEEDGSGSVHLETADEGLFLQGKAGLQM